MTQVAIHLDANSSADRRYRAVTAGRVSTGRTAGEALDALLAEEYLNIETSPVLIQAFSPDEFFTKEQHEKMKELMTRRDSLSQEDNAELDVLIDAELNATIQRTAHLLPTSNR
jgi:hypothetical protein